MSSARVKTFNKAILIATSFLASAPLFTCRVVQAEAQTGGGLASQVSSIAPHADDDATPISTNYRQVKQRLARGWNTWDANSVTTHVLLPGGLAIHIGLKHNNTVSGEGFLQDALIGRLTPDAEQVTPGPHSWDGRYTDLRISWKGHSWRVQSARQGSDLILLTTPLASKSSSVLPPTIVFSIDFLWNQPGTAVRHPNFIETRGASGTVNVYCTRAPPGVLPKINLVNLPTGGPYFAADLNRPVGLSTGKRRTLAEIEAVISHQQDA